MKIEAVFSKNKIQVENRGEQADYYIRTKLALDIASRLIDNPKAMKVDVSELTDLPDAETQFRTTLFVLTEHQRETIRQDLEIISRKHPEYKPSLDYILDTIIGK